MVAKSLGPAQLLDYEKINLRGVILEEGSPTAHVAIVARALNLPIIGRIRGACDRIADGDLLIVDGDRAQVFVRPGEDVQKSFDDTIRAQAERDRHYVNLVGLPADSRDGHHVALLVNAGLQVDVEQISQSGADGVGLFRTEIQIMMHQELPSLDHQTEMYACTLEMAAGKPITFRTLDIGGDKTLPYIETEDEENPTMGWRAIRIGLDRPMILRRQLRALIRAAKQTGAELSVMFPMITEVAEFDAAKKLLERELAAEGLPKDGGAIRVKAGAMLEVPALLYQMRALLERVDFLSVGSNDLMQFLFASDRGNPRLAGRYDTLSPAALRVFHDVAGKCALAGRPVTVCGEMAGLPLEAMALIGLGLRNLSMASPGIGPVKEMTRSLDVGSLREYMLPLLDSPERTLRGKLRSYALDHGVAV